MSDSTSPDPDSLITRSRFSAATVDHFQHPRNVGALPDADAVGRVDDPETDTTVTLYLRLSADRGVVARATFRTFGCSACIAASSVATELATGRAPVDLRALDAGALDRALGGLPADRRYCADLVALALARMLAALPEAMLPGAG